MYNPSMYLPQSQVFDQFNQTPQFQQPAYLNHQSVGTDYTVKVNGRQSAYQYCQKMGPNCTSPALFDTTQVGIMYIGTTDGAGMPTIETFDYSPHVEEQTSPAIDTSQYVSRSEFDDVVKQLKEAINGIHGQSQAAAATASSINPQPVQPVAAGQADRR